MIRPPTRTRIAALVLLSVMAAIWWVGVVTVWRWVF